MMKKPSYAGNRMREAREYLGFSIVEVAGFLGILTFDLRRIEDGKRWLSVELEERVSRLYRRPIAYLRGESQEPIEISPQLDTLLSETSLSAGDRSEVLDFVQFLQYRSDITGPIRADGDSDA